jgi:translation initiation factor eIF-2B subunit alpha
MTGTDQKYKQLFEDLLKKDQTKSTGVACIETLLDRLKSSKANTLSELDNELDATIKAMLLTDVSSASISSAAKLFLRFIALIRIEKPDSDFKQLMQVYMTNGDHFVKRIKESRDLIAKLAVPFIQQNAKLLVHSYSKVVLHALIEAKKRGRVFKVFVTESHPDGTGKKMHTALQEHDIDSTLILDGAAA